MINLQNIHSITDLQRNPKALLAKLKESSKPLVLTVNGRPELVVQDAASYQALVDEVEQARFLAAVREGMKAAEEGRVKELDAAFEEIRGKLGL